MEECPFLSTYERDVECFRECVLYNYKGAGGICPFKNLVAFKERELQDKGNEIDLLEGELDFIRKPYLEINNPYL